MQDLRHVGFNELVETALRERLVDACENQGDHVVIVQGAMRVELSQVRAHAFLRGIIEGMSRVRARQRHLTSPADAASTMDVLDDTVESDVPEGARTLDAFRHYLLTKWWTRYEEAGCPFGQNRRALMLWIQYGSATTAS